MKKYISLFLFLVLATSSFALPPIIKDYMKVNEDVWNSGKVCRHAAVKLASMAEIHNFPYYIATFYITNSEEKHAVFVVQYNDRWYVIDSIIDHSSGKYKARQASYSYDPQSVEEFEVVSDRGLSKMIGHANSSLIDAWRNEDTTLNVLLSEINVELEKINLFKQFIHALQELVVEMQSDLKRQRELLEDK